MNLRWVLVGCGERFELMVAPTAASRGSLAAHAAAALLRSRLADPHDARVLREVAAALVPGVPARGDAEVLARLVRALDIGRLVVVRSLPSMVAFVPQQPRSERPVDVAANDEPVDTRSHWVGLRVVDDDSAAPVADVELVVVLPDRSEVRVTTDGDGRASLRSAEAGSCELRSTGDAEHFSLGITFVGFGRAVPRERAVGTGERVVRGRALRGPARRALLDVLEHRVRDGDTWDTIAGSHGTTAAALTTFNFDSVDPVAVQVAMSQHLGCWRRDRTSGDLVFTDHDEPGLVLVPRPWQRSVTTGYEHVLRVRAIHAPVRAYVFSA